MKNQTNADICAISPRVHPNLNQYKLRRKNERVRREFLIQYQITQTKK